MNSKLTILIPTRDREDYLPFAIQSCLQSSYPNLEVIVCDNSSTAHTREVCHLFSDPRLKYVKSPEFLSMSANWEFALNQVKEGFVSILGDDDAFLQGGIEKAMNWIHQYQLPAISWRQASYRWPGNEFARIKELYQLPISQGFSIRNPGSYVKAVLKAKLHPNHLPCIYHGIIHLDYIQQVKKQSEGLFFHSRIPDYYAIVALSCVVPKYMYSYWPISIAGSSPKSNGNVQLRLESKFENLKNEFSKGKDDVPFHPSLEFVHLYSILIWECLLQASQNGLKSFDGWVNPDRQLQQAIKEAAAFKVLDHEWDKLCQIANKFHLRKLKKPEYFRRQFYKWQYHLKHYIFFWTSSVFIDCKRENISNIMELSKMHDKLKSKYGQIPFFIFYNLILLYRHFLKQISFKRNRQNQ
ncbi:MAG: glycosyltransferase family 2 protein [Saprospiraceae bacterium]|nr:glycosyltransferase family 2 protein [Saprospiraceae bacterium]